MHILCVTIKDVESNLFHNILLKESRIKKEKRYLGILSTSCTYVALLFDVCNICNLQDDRPSLVVPSHGALLLCLCTG